MVWIGGPRRDPGDRLGRGRRGLYLHDPPPGYHPPRPRIPMKDQQRKLRQDYVLMRIVTVVLILTTTAFLAMMLFFIAAHS